MSTGRWDAWIALGLLLALTVASAVWSVSTAPRVPIRNATADSWSVQIHLNTTRAVAGHPIKGMLIIENPHAAINLTQVVKGGCEPGFAIILTKGSFRNGVGFAASCTNRAFVISHGTTRLPFSMLTSYTSCLPPNGSSSIGTPRCLQSEGLPPLPAGSYKADIEWSATVPLPRPTPVAVDLT